MQRVEIGALPLLMFALVMMALLTAVAYLLVQHLRRRDSLRLAAEHQARELEIRVAIRTAELSRLSTSLINEAEAERLALAEQLHGEMGGFLTAAKMDVNWLQNRAAAGTDSAISNKLRSASQLLDNAMNMKRRVVESLRPSLLSHFGLLVAIGAHFEDRCAEAGLKCVVNLPEALPSLEFSRQLALFRAAQQALETAIQLGRARSVTLSIEPDDEGVVMLVVDDGVATGPDDSPPAVANGLSGMRHRIESLGGRLDIASLGGSGTQLRVMLPSLPGAPEI